MSRFLANFKKYRFLLAELVKKDIKLKYRRSYLGILWTLLEPLLTMLVLTLVFGTFYGKDDKSFPVYILTGRLLYTFFNNATKAATKSIRSNAGMIKKVYVPKYVYPLSSILSNYITFLISLIILVVVCLVLGVYPTKYALFAIVPLLSLFVMSLGVGMILATFSVFFRDLEYLWGVVLMLIMYSSAIFYSPDRLIGSGVGWILKFNPLYACIYNFRTAVFGATGSSGYPLDMYYVWFAAIFSLVTLLFGTYMFYKKQDQFILNI